MALEIAGSRRSDARREKDSPHRCTGWQNSRAHLHRLVRNSEEMLAVDYSSIPPSDRGNAHTQHEGSSSHFQRDQRRYRRADRRWNIWTARRIRVSPDDLRRIRQAANWGIAGNVGQTNTLPD